MNKMPDRIEKPEPGTEEWNRDRGTDWNGREVVKGKLKRERARKATCWSIARQSGPSPSVILSEKLNVNILPLHVKLPEKLNACLFACFVVLFILQGKPQQTTVGLLTEQHVLVHVLVDSSGIFSPDLRFINRVSHIMPVLISALFEKKH